MAVVIDTRRLRNALGCFPTGVTVVTTIGPDGNQAGITANSFSSVSLVPPLVLWSLIRSARSFDAFTTAEWFAINVLAADQLEIGLRFASRVEDKFHGLSVKEEPRAPRLEGSVAWFLCRRRDVHEGGDHVIVVGEVVDFDYDTRREPLVFRRGEYTVAGGSSTPGTEDEEA